MGVLLVAGFQGRQKHDAQLKGSDEELGPLHEPHCTALHCIAALALAETGREHSALAPAEHGGPGSCAVPEVRCAKTQTAAGTVAPMKSNVP